MKKRGMSAVVTTLIIILVTIVALGIIWVLVKNFVLGQSEEIELKRKFFSEEIEFVRVKIEGSTVNMAIKTIGGKIEANESEEETIPVEVDIILVLDRSGSMRQSGWILETSLSAENTTTLIVPRNAYSSTYSFSVPPGTQRLAVAIDWEKITGFNGSEGSEFALNLRRPAGTWIANSGNYPSELGGKVDPPDSIGMGNEYFSGISTKPQYFYIEDPQNGIWQAKVYGWNLRPKSSPPSAQNVSVQIYMGNSSSLNKSLTIISSDTVKSASKSFIDRLDEKDQAAIVRFGSYAELTQSLSSNKTTIKNAIDNIGSEGGTYINTGIDIATQHLTTTGRSDAVKIITILTDGQNDMGPDPVIASAQLAKDKDFTIFTIGLTNFVDENMLKTIATKPEYYYYSDFDKLNEIYQEIAEKIKTTYTSIHQFNYLLFVFYNETDSYKESTQEIPEVLGTKNYEINLSGKLEGELIKIEIYPLIISSSGKETIGLLMDVWERK